MKKQSKNTIIPKNRSVKNYLDSYLYPTMQKAVDEVFFSLL